MKSAPSYFNMYILSGNKHAHIHTYHALSSQHGRALAEHYVKNESYMFRIDKNFHLKK